MELTIWLVRAVLLFAQPTEPSDVLRVSASVRTVRDGAGPLETFAVACAWITGRPETLTCRQVEAPQ